MKTQKFCLLINRYFTLAAIFTLIQQLIAASSTYFIAKLGESFGAGEVSLGYIVLFIVSLVVVYALPILPSSLLKKAIIWHGKVT